MVMRLLLALICSIALGACKAPSGASRGERLQGYTVLDIGARRAQVRDLWVADGKVFSSAPAGSDAWPVRQGSGRWILPAYWDILTASWGNASTQHYTKLFQSMGSDTLARTHLSMGVGHVVAGLGNGAWFQGGLKRDQAMQIFGAECLRSTRIFCGPAQDTPGGVTLGASADVGPSLAQELAQGAVYVLVSYSRSSKPFPAVGPAELKALIQQGQALGLPVLVSVFELAEAKEALALGADGLLSGPLGPGGQELFKAMARRGAAWGPLLAATLELSHLQKADGVLDDPAIPSLLRADIIADYRNPSTWGQGTRDYSKWVSGREAQLFEDLRQAKAAGVRLLAPTSAGWAPAVFQGLGVHRQMRFMVKAGLDPWDALEAATLSPARFLGRPAGLQDGAPADLVVLDADPTADIRHAASIVEVARGGRWGKPQDLKPDLWRRAY